VCQRLYLAHREAELPSHAHDSLGWGMCLDFGQAPRMAFVGVFKNVDDE
jgi:hypothetical protein